MAGSYGVQVSTPAGYELIYNETGVAEYKVKAATKILKGENVCIGADGWAVKAADTAGLQFVGKAIAEADNTSGADGALKVAVRRTGIMKMPTATTLAQTNVGDNVYAADEVAVDITGNATNNVLIGLVTAVDGDYVDVDVNPAILQTDVATHIADGSAAHAASAVSIADAGNFTAQTTVEAALQEIYPFVPVAVADPGDAGAIPVTRNGAVALTTTAAQTRTLAGPPAVGRILAITLSVDGGDCVITTASAVDQTGRNTITMGDAGDTIVLMGVQVGEAKAWRVLLNAGCVLGTV